MYTYMCSLLLCTYFILCVCASLFWARARALHPMSSQACSDTPLLCTPRLCTYFILCVCTSFIFSTRARSSYHELSGIQQYSAVAHSVEAESEDEADSDINLIESSDYPDQGYPLPLWGISYYLVSALPHRQLPCKLGMSAQFAITMKIGDVCAEFHLSWIVRGPMPVWHMLLYVPLLGTYRIVLPPSRPEQRNEPPRSIYILMHI